MQRREFAGWLAASGLIAAMAPREAQAEPLVQPQAKVAKGSRAVAATVHPRATQAAMEAFARGGNAVDAAVAASIMLSVVDIHNSGLGGGGLLLVRTPQGEVFAVDGRERAPLAASPETYLRGGSPDPSLSQTGPLAAATPGLPALLEHMSQRWGTLDWRPALLASAEVAEQGFPIDGPMARNLVSSLEQIRKFPESAQVLLNPQGQPWREGERMVQTDLARSLRQLAEQGAAWFYQGEFAQRTEQLMQASGGLLNRRDFSDYRLGMRQPIESLYRQQRVYGFPPPSSGGIHIAQMLGMLSRYDIKQIFAESTANGYHLLAEVMKRAMADRAHWLGDADYAGVPRGLLADDYLADRAKDIDLARASAVAGHGMPSSPHEDLFGPGKHTTHLTTADQQGFVVALTQTINTSFGSKMIVPGTGILLNNEMDDFSLAPGVRNAFGLVGSAANAVAPGKRPLSSMSPTIVIDPAGAFRFSCGAAGGPKIITATLQVIVRMLDLGQTIDQAISAARIHHQWSPDTLACEESLSAADQQRLASLGHQLQMGKMLAVAQGIEKQQDGSLVAASDPRVPSSAAALS